MKACFQSHPTSDLLESEGFQTNAAFSIVLLGWCLLFLGNFPILSALLAAV